MKKIFTFFFFVVTSFFYIFADFNQANSLYDSGQYEQAAKAYEDLIQSKGGSAAIYYNLGNTYFKLNHLGKAIYYFKRALILSPFKSDLVFNYHYAQSKILDKLGEPSLTDKFLQKIPKNVVLIYFAVLSFLFWSLMIFLLFFQNRKISLLMKIVRPFYITLLILFLLGQFKNESFGVINSTEGKVYSAVGRDNVVLFTLHEGAEFKIEESLGNEWVRLVMNDGKKGWVKVSDILIYRS